MVDRLPDGKMPVTSGSWNAERVILKDQVLEIRNVDQRVHVARRAKKPDGWDRRSWRKPVSGDVAFVSGDE